MQGKTKRLIGALTPKRAGRGVSMQIPHEVLSEVREWLAEQDKDMHGIEALLRARTKQLELALNGGEEFPDICGFPLLGWKLEHLGPKVEVGHPTGWTATLRREPICEHDWPTWLVKANSDLGPLEAWEEAIRMARRDDARRLEATGAFEEQPTIDLTYLDGRVEKIPAEPE